MMPYAGTIDSTPPTSAPQIGAPSARSATSRTPTAHHAPRRPPTRCASRPARMSAAAASAAYPALPNPMKRPATDGENPSALLNWSGLPSTTSTTSTATSTPSPIIAASRSRPRAMTRYSTPSTMEHTARNAQYAAAPTSWNGNNRARYTVGRYARSADAHHGSAIRNRR